MGFFSGIVDSVKDVVGGVGDFVSDNIKPIASAVGSYFGIPVGGFLGGGTDEEMTSAIFDGWSLSDIAKGASSAFGMFNNISPALGGYLSYQGANSANEANERMFNTGLSWAGGEANRTREFNALESARNRDWQAWQASLNRNYATDMSNTSWQRGVADMKKAGINPMLAFSKGGASTPTVGSGPGGQGSSGIPGYSLSRMENALGAGVNSALAAATTGAMVDRTKAETDRIRMETLLTEAQIPRTRQDTLTSASAEELNIARRANASLEYNKMLREIDLLSEHINVRKEDVQIAKENVRNAYLTGKNIEANTSNTRMNTLLNSLDEQKKRNEAEAEKTPWKRNVSPFLGDVGRITSSAQDLRGMSRPTITPRGGARSYL